MSEYVQKIDQLRYEGIYIANSMTWVCSLQKKKNSLLGPDLQEFLQAEFQSILQDFRKRFVFVASGNLT